MQTTTKINNVSAAFFHSRATEVTEHSSMNSTFGQRACSVHVSPHVVSMPYMTVTRDSAVYSTVVKQVVRSLEGPLRVR